MNVRTIFTVIVEFKTLAGQFFVQHWYSRHPVNRLSEEVICELERLTLRKSMTLASVQIVDFQRL